MIEIGSEVEATGRRAEPLVVIAHLSEPIVYQRDGIHLDGILAACAFRDLPQAERAKIPPPDAADFAVDVDVPLARWRVPRGIDHGRHAEELCDERGRLWGFCASVERGEVVGETLAAVRKRAAVSQCSRWSSDAKLETASGPLKGYDLSIPAVLVHELRWTALGDGSEVERLLLRYARAIGGKRGIGWGRVLGWRVEPGSTWSPTDEDEAPTRAFPVESGMAGVPTIGAFRPPYYHRSRRWLVVQPEGI